MVATILLLGFVVTRTDEYDTCKWMFQNEMVQYCQVTHCTRSREVQVECAHKECTQPAPLQSKCKVSTRSEPLQSKSASSALNNLHLILSSRSALDLHLSRESAQGVHSTCTTPELVHKECTQPASLQSKCKISTWPEPLQIKCSSNLHLSRASAQPAPLQSEC